MKPTQEQILSALNKLVRENKTELKAEKIELSLVSDFNSDYSKAVNKSLGLAEEAADLSDKKDNLISEINKNISSFEKLEKPFNTIVKQAKELGVDINDILKDRPKLGNSIKSMQNALKILK
tara:strand:+ start:184 stop:549 length:366 start_codon:yes stop_codon:yes gene_type:complete